MGLGAEGWGGLHFLLQHSSLAAPPPLPGPEMFAQPPSLFGLSKPLLKLYLKTFFCNFTITLKLTQNKK